MTNVRTTLTLFGGDVVSHRADVSGAGLQSVGLHRNTQVYAIQGASGRWGCSSTTLAGDARSYAECETLDDPVDTSVPINLLAWLGQSNARGADPTYTYTPAAGTDGRRHFFDLAGAWGDFDVEPLHKLPAIDSIQTGQADGGFSAALRTVELLCASRTTEHWAALGAAVSGSALSTWAQSTSRGTNYGHAWARIRQALRRPNVVFRGIVWYQGESDTGDETLANTYATRAQTLFDAWRSDLAMPDLPIFVIRIRSDHPGTYVSTVRAQQALLAQASPPQIVIDAPEGAGTLFDSTHLNVTGQNALADLLAPAIEATL